MQPVPPVGARRNPPVPNCSPQNTWYVALMLTDLPLGEKK